MDAFTHHIEDGKEPTEASAGPDSGFTSVDDIVSQSSETSSNRDLQDDVASFEAVDFLSNSASKLPLFEGPELLRRLNVFEEVELGGTVTFECQCKAFPTPSSKWYKDDVELIEDDRLKIEDSLESDGTMRLIIREAKKSDEGAYRCKLENQEGVAATTGYLSVAGGSDSAKSEDANSSEPSARTTNEELNASQDSDDLSSTPLEKILAGEYDLTALPYSQYLELLKKSASDSNSLGDATGDSETPKVTSLTSQSNDVTSLNTGFSSDAPFPSSNIKVNEIGDFVAIETDNQTPTVDDVIAKDVNQQMMFEGNFGDPVSQSTVSDSISPKAVSTYGMDFDVNLKNFDDNVKEKVILIVSEAGGSTENIAEQQDSKEGEHPVEAGLSLDEKSLEETVIAGRIGPPSGWEFAHYTSETDEGETVNLHPVLEDSQGNLELRDSVEITGEASVKPQTDLEVVEAPVGEISLSEKENLVVVSLPEASLPGGGGGGGDNIFDEREALLKEALQEVNGGEAPLKEEPLEALQREAPSEGVLQKEAPSEGVLQKEAPSEGVLQKEAPSEGVLQKEAPSEGVLQNEAPSEGVLQKEAPSEGVLQKEAPSDVVLQREAPYEGVLQKEAPSEEVLQKEASFEGMLQKEAPSEVLQKEAPSEELLQKEARFEGVLQKEAPSEVALQEEPLKEAHLKKAPLEETLVLQNAVNNSTQLTSNLPESIPKPEAETVSSVSEPKTDLPAPSLSETSIPENTVAPNESTEAHSAENDFEFLPAKKSETWLPEIPSVVISGVSSLVNWGTDSTIPDPVAEASDVHPSVDSPGDAESAGSKSEDSVASRFTNFVSELSPTVSKIAEWIPDVPSISSYLPDTTQQSEGEAKPTSEEDVTVLPKSVELSSELVIEWLIDWFRYPWVFYVVLALSSGLIGSATQTNPALVILVVAILSLIGFQFLPGVRSSEKRQQLYEPIE